MATFDARSSIADCIASHPRTRAAFAAWGLDTCCDGKATLAEAAVFAKIPLVRLLDTLESVAAGGEPPPPAADRNGCAPPPIASHREIRPDSIVADVIDTWPATLPILVEAGFTPLQNALLRRTLARTITLARACSMQGIDLEKLIARLRQATQARE